MTNRASVLKKAGKAVSTLLGLLLYSTGPAFSLSDIASDSGPAPFRQLLQKADSGDNMALWEAGQRYLLGEGLSQDTETAVKYLETLAQNGDNKASVYLANHYRKGQYLPHDRDKMLFWYEKAAGNGDPWAAYELGKFHETGNEEIPINQQGAHDWYEKALKILEEEAKNTHSDFFKEYAYWAGNMYSTGRGTVASAEKAFSWWQKSALAGYGPAQRLLGLSYLHGTGVKQDTRSARDWLARAMANGEEGAAMEHALAVSRIDGPAAAEKEIEQIGAQSGPLRQWEIARFYREGYIVPQNPARAFSWTQKAASGGIVDAQYALGTAYWTGEGVPRNFFKAWTAFKEAADKGHPEADDMLSVLFKWGAVAAALFCLLLGLTGLIAYSIIRKKRNLRPFEQ